MNPTTIWDGYLADFHTQHPGITEDVLARAHHAGEDGGDPYDWLAEALPADGVVVDVACGSGPLARLVGDRWIGLDRNLAELGRAATAAPGRLVLADAAAMPLGAGSVDGVVCAMALMLFEVPGAVVADMASLLRPGGRFVALLPAAGPLTTRDRLRYLRLLAALRLRRLPFRHHDLLDDPSPLLVPAGLTLVDVEARRFAYPVAEPGDADHLVRSLYLPDVAPQRSRSAQRLARRWTGTDLGIPLRRLVATKPN